MQIISTILPIFFVIFLGWAGRKKRFIPDGFIGPANQLVYYIAIPAMIFGAVAKASFYEAFNPVILAVTLFTIFMISALSWAMANALKIPTRTKGTFIQTTFHGNLEYVGLAVVFYSLGDSGLAAAGIFAGFIMIFQNILAVFVLEFHGTDRNQRDNILMTNAQRIIGHPVILSAVSGIVFSIFKIPIPLIVERTLDILSGMALPLALLLIGASLSFKLIRTNLSSVLGASLFKLILMPGLGLVLFQFFEIPQNEFRPVFILLCSPTATLAYVMAREMNGNAEFAVAAISACTMLSAITFTLWLHFLS
ncbi:putative transporter of auxin efflux carrier family [Desulforapulum autotrophicum HRM2]|uniref:Transporter of auxin efflux carrier family n=1 Tax=Desulforapulum autotrophicum (strain ATCC 43914 / DSM 3382 / VKM B-1955 / HRM2) TaxID=177437 RepID=C0QLR3_DESAH|nr:AEC family transporter [Desulforapulum autotrophicum]ACN16367.1 putative transporter of auxin efflux carrier family [Desulforapulum autotrophicum HRM2]